MHDLTIEDGACEKPDFDTPPPEQPKGFGGLPIHCGLVNAPTEREINQMHLTMQVACYIALGNRIPGCRFKRVAVRVETIKGVGELNWEWHLYLHYSGMPGPSAFLSVEDSAGVTVQEAGRVLARLWEEDKEKHDRETC